MSSPSKQKGNRFENELVDLAKGYGLSAQRAWGSNGRAMGEHEEVDCKIEEFTVQAKRRKSIAKDKGMKWYKVTEIEEEWAFDKKKDKMVLRNRIIKKHGETELVESSMKIKKDKTNDRNKD